MPERRRIDQIREPEFVADLANLPLKELRSRRDLAEAVETELSYYRRLLHGRMVEVEWAPTAQSMFLVAIQVEALDRARLLSDVTRVLSDVHVNILSASVATGRDRIAKSRFTFEMADPAHLGHVLKAVRTVDGVFDAYRVTQ